MTEFIPPSKECKYGCGKMVYWDNNLDGKLKWREVDGGAIHSYPRCADILKSQNKDLRVLKKK